MSRETARRGSYRWPTRSASLASLVLRLSTCLLGLVLFFTAREAKATPTARLIYLRGEGAEKCPAEDELRKAVVQRLGYDPFFPVAKVTLVAEVERRDKGGFTGKVKVIDADGLLVGTRVIPSASSECAELVRVLALNLSITVDDLALLLPEKDRGAPAVEVKEAPEVPEQPSPAPTQGPGSAKDPPPAEPPDEVKPSTRTVFPEAALLLVGAAGKTPAVTLGIGASLGLRVRALRVSGELVALLPSEGSEGGNRGRAQITEGTLAVCYHLALPFACAKGSVGSLEGSGALIASPKTGRALVAGAGIEAGAEFPLTDHLSLRALADVRFALVRPRIDVGGTPVFRTPPASLTLGFAAVVRF